MRRKLLVMILALVGTFSMVYAKENLLDAANKIAYETGSNVTGRIHIPPTNISTPTSSNTFGFQKGDRFYMFGQDQEDLGFQLIASDAYTDYLDGTANNPSMGDEINAWYCLSTEEIGHGPLAKDTSKYEVAMSYHWPNSSTIYFKDTTIYPKYQSLNATVNTSPELQEIIAPQNLEYKRAWLDNLTNNSYTFATGIHAEEFLTDWRGKVIFPVHTIEGGYILTSYESGGKGIDGISTSDFAFSESYHLDETMNSTYSSNYIWTAYVDKTGALKTSSPSLQADLAFRSAVYFDPSKVVFAISLGNGSTYSQISSPVLDSTYVYKSAGEKMKVRILNANMKADLLSIQNIEGTEIHTVSKGQKVKLNVDANSYQNSIISAFIFKDGIPYYYMPLESSKTGLIDCDLSMLEKGIYEIAIVNEIYDSADAAPTYSSLISDVKSIEVIDSITQLAFTPTTQLEYGKNVNAGSTIGLISSKNGSGTPKYTLVADPSHPSDVTHFELDMDGKTVVVKDAVLDAGTYYFKIQAQDGNGNPTAPLEISASITVAKTDPDLKFSTTAAINKVVGDSAFTESFTHKNMDTGDATFLLSYSSSNSSIALADTPSSNTDTDIEITPGNQTGTTNIKVELAETKNFKSASASLTVNVHPKISLAFTPEKPAFAVNEVLTKGTKVGKVTLTGNSPNYTYSMAVDPSDGDAGANNGMFIVSSTSATNSKKMDILTDTANIGQGTYYITIKVVDAYGQIAYAKGMIHVSGTAQTDFKFYDYTNPSMDITNGTLTLYYGETSAKLIASGTQSTGAVTYGLDDPTTDIIEVDPTDGDITVKKVGKVKVKATKAADATYSAATIYMDVDVKQVKQEISFDDPNTTTITYDNANGNSFSENANGKIKTGMPNAGAAGVGGIAYSLGGSDASVASIDSSNGDIQINAGQNITSMKTFIVTAKLNESGTASYNANYEGATVTKTINVYPPGSATWNQTSKPEADKNTGNEKIGDVSVTGGSGSITFAISTSGDADNLDKGFFDIDPTSGEVVLKKKITANDLVSKTYNTTQKAYEMKVMIDVSDGGNVNTEHLTIYITGADRANLDFKNKDKTTQEITETYDVNKQFQLSLTQNITGTECRISTNPSHASPSDVITVNTNGKADILNANEVNIAGSTTSPVYVEAVAPASSGYKEMIIEAPVRIKRKDQTLTFSQDPINTSADIQSLNVSVSGHLDTQPLIFTSDNNMIDVNADPSDLDQVIIKPNGTVANGIKISAQAQGDRNHKDIKKDVTLNIAQAGTQQFSVVFPSMTYGDTGPFKVSIIPAGDGTETYTYEVKDTNILDIDSNGNITIHHAGTTSVKVTKTSTGGVVGPYTFNVTVKPKPITITIDDEEKYVGMAMPTFHANIPTLVGSDMLPQPDFTCEKADGSTVNEQTEQGTYDISGSYANPNPDYKITVSKGELTVKQDSASTSWYHLEDADGNTTQSGIWHKNPVDLVLNPNSNATAGTYDEISGDSTFTNTDKTRFTVSSEGETTQDIYFRINPTGSDPNKGSTTPPIQETIRIDRTAPIIKSISGKHNGNSKTREFLNAVTFGQIFKPGLVVNIQAEDVTPNAGTNISGIAKTSYVINQLDSDGKPIGQGNTIDQQDDSIEISLKEPGNYEVCATATDNAGNESSEKCEEFEVKKIDVDVDKDGKPDFNDPDGNGCADFNIVYKDEDGNWVTLNEDKDRDGIPERNIDTDGDGEPDINVDTDNDGKPDLNLVILTKDDWKPAQCVTQHGELYASIVDIKPQINIDNDPATPNIPNINIDTDGDMIADINIDQNQNGELDAYDFNITSSIKSWKPEQDYTVDGFNYDTEKEHKAYVNVIVKGTDLPSLNIDTNGNGLPDLNIDRDGNGVPETNIDSDGDGIADMNLDPKGTGTPQSNVYEITEWLPDTKVSREHIDYLTIKINKQNELEDNGIKVEKPDGTFLPNFAIKVNDVTDTKKEEIQKEASSIIGEQEIKAVYDVRLLKDNVETQPDGSIKVKIPLPEGIENPKVLVKKSNGSFEEVEAKIENGYLVYETDELGTVSVLGDSATKPTEPIEPTKPLEPEPTIDNPNTSVQGTYTRGIGGANTGDATSLSLFLLLGSISIFTLGLLYKKAKN